MSATNTPVTYTAAGGVVISPSGEEILLLIRPSRDEVRLPKGHVEPGEAALETALREVREESGYAELDPISDLGEQLVTFLLDDQRIERTEHYFLIQARSMARVTRPSHDVQQFFTVWVSWSQAEAHLTFEAEQEWVRRARRAWERQR